MYQNGGEQEAFFKESPCGPRQSSQLKDSALLAHAFPHTFQALSGRLNIPAKGAETGLEAQSRDKSELSGECLGQVITTCFWTTRVGPPGRASGGAGKRPWELLPRRVEPRGVPQAPRVSAADPHSRQPTSDTAEQSGSAGQWVSRLDARQGGGPLSLIRALPARLAVSSVTTVSALL